MRRFAAEAAYADSLFRSALGDQQGVIEALEQALEAMPTYAPAIPSLGSVEYQLHRPAKGRRLFHSRLELPYQAGQVDEARRLLERAAAMDPTDSLAGENLRICMRAFDAREAPASSAKSRSCRT